MDKAGSAQTSLSHLGVCCFKNGPSSKQNGPTHLGTGVRAGAWRAPRTSGQTARCTARSTPPLLSFSCYPRSTPPLPSSPLLSSPLLLFLSACSSSPHLLSFSVLSSSLLFSPLLPSRLVLSPLISSSSSPPSTRLSLPQPLPPSSPPSATTSHGTSMDSNGLGATILNSNALKPPGSLQIGQAVCTR